MSSLLRLLALTAVLLLAGGCGGSPSTIGEQPAVAGARVEATVQRVVDGDTVVLAPGGRARLIGIDTPEVSGRAECYGPEASAFTKRLLRPGDRVRYEVGREPRDRYRRTLIYLWLDDGRLLNELLVAGGHAVALTISPNDDHAARLEGLARRARQRRVGLWSGHACRGSPGP